jgi:hypothetical protein
VSRHVEGVGGNREVPPPDFRGGAEANWEKEGGTRGKHGFLRVTEPEAKEVAA